MPYFYELCIASWQVMNPNREIQIYTNHKLHLSFLDRTITKVIDLNDKYGDVLEYATENLVGFEHQSDYIRYNILAKERSIYLDTDVLLYENLDNIVDLYTYSTTAVVFPMEDKNMICNCFIMSLKPEAEYIFNDIINNYKENYIQHSYLFNSQKYLWLISRRYKSYLQLHTDNTLFHPNFFSLPADFEEIKNNMKKVPGLGYHITNTNRNWYEFKKYLDDNCYNLEPSNEIEQFMTDVINKYIKLMKEADN